MPKFQLIGCKINIAGDRNTTIVRDRFDPVTYPEYLVLQAVHGGEEHVYDAVVVGERETNDDERERLVGLYGRELTLAVFPGAMRVLPLGDDTIPTLEEIEEVRAAAQKARDTVRAKKSKKKADPVEPPKDAADDGALPDLTAPKK